MGVHVVGHAVRRPARVGDADASAEVLALQEVFQIGHLALALVYVERTVIAHQRYARTVVTPVFEPVESLYKDRTGVAPADITYNSAHGFFLFECEFTKYFPSTA